MRTRLLSTRFFLYALALAGLLLMPGGGGRSNLDAQAGDPCATAINPISCENAKPGNPASEWDVAGAGSSTIQGFATEISVNPGETIGFKVDTTATSYRIDIYRLGFYGGLGARKVATIDNPSALPQPACTVEGATGLVDCGTWLVSASWPVPADAITGVYIAKLVRTDGTAGASHVPFVVRDDAGRSDILFQTSDTTWHAYNTYGGNSLYVGSPAGRAYKVSYNRPITTRGTTPEDYLFNAEYPMIRWLEANGYDVSYSTGVDSDRRGAEILEHKVFLSVGHDEYWSGAQRGHVEAARDAGVHLAFFSGNEVFWKTRWEPSIDGSGQEYRTLVSYKETHANAKIDPLPGVWTGTWRDPRFAATTDGGRPENALTGQIFTVNCCTYAITVPEAFGKTRLWRNTSIATLAAGQVATLPTGTLGYEWDEDLDNGFRPSGLIRMSETTVSGVDRILDHGSNYGAGVATHSLTMYRATSGALVFGAGTVQWSWGLDATHDRGGAAADTRMRQATVNLFADMGVQPSTLQAGLTAATASSDLTGPTATITSPSAGATLSPNTAITISGTAADAGGGIVSLVEVSVDGGLTWRRASGLASWTYAWTTPAAGSVTIRARGFDDSGNRQLVDASVTVSVGTAPGGGNPNGLVAEYGFTEGSGMVATDTSGRANNGTITNATFTAAGKNGPGLSFNGTNALVTIPDSASLDLTNGMTLEAWVRPTSLGTAWRTLLLKENGSELSYSLYAHDGTRPASYVRIGNDRWVTGGSALALNTWTHVAATYDGAALRLYVNGTQVASAAMTGNMAVGTGALRIGGNQIWGEYFAGQMDDVRVYSRALTAAQIQTDMVTPVNPPDTFPPTVTGVTPLSGAVDVIRSTNVTVTFNEEMAAASIDATTIELRNAANQLVPASVTYNSATLTATLDPVANLAYNTVYTATVRGGAADPRVKDAAGNALATPVSWSFTIAPQGLICPCSVFEPTQVPAVLDSNDGNGVELGMKFRSDRAGYITAVRFYKSDANTGTHVGNLWGPDGTRLASVLFGNETANGWQQASFSPAVAIAANTTYTVSYYAPRGRYSVTASAFTSAVDSLPLHALATGTSPNGVYVYGTASAFPTNSFNAGNYWVDVVFEDTVVSDTTPPVASALSPANGAAAVPLASAVTATFNEGMDASTIGSSTFELRRGTTLVASTVTYNALTRVVTLQPSAQLSAGLVYTATLRGGSTDPRIKDAAGNALAANVTWSFTTAAAPPPPPNEGPGGPVLVIASSTNPFGRYYSEILRNEGLNLFTVTDISLVTATSLNAYDVVVLGEMTLTPAQVTMLTGWVQAGGNLIAMRPDKQLASLLGLSDAGTTLADRYLLIDPAGPGAGLVDETIQFHGTADLYALNGATAVATLYSSATVSTANPAVTLRTVGAGQAAAFTFDLARSVVYTRQGNPAWAGQERDGVGPIRSDDMFVAGGGQPDWVDLTKVAIPQADEQQRLFANLIRQMNMDRKPLPSFWYLPRGLKAAVVMTGDDHGIGGSAGRFDLEKAASPANCSVANWECVRSTSYIYPNTPITNAQAASYTADGFELAVHISTGCSNYTQASLTSNFVLQLADFTNKYTSVPAPTTNRTHCIVFSDWASTPLVSLSQGIRLDTNYYYWPASWVQNRPGFFTGSGMPMRFANTDGTLIDVYQATTQMTDESNQTFPFTIDALLDGALGTRGYYGVFTANMHTDYAVHTDGAAIVNSAVTRGVPVVSARQMLTWLDGRNASSFGSMTWSGGVLSFTITPGTGATGLRAMLPLPTGTPLVALTRNGAAWPYQAQTIKGVNYIVFEATAGTYAASFVPLPDTTITSAPAATVSTASATFSFTSSAAGATFECAVDGGAFAPCTSPRTLTGLAAGAHTFSVRSINATGADPTPATHAWTIVAPETTITSGPAASTTATTAAFSFTSDVAGATFECSLDNAAFAACTSPRNLTGLALGAHTFAVRAVNAIGADATPATHSWSVVLAVPDTTITSGPAASTAATTASFVFTSNLAGTTFECSLDGAAFVGCSSPTAFSGLAIGAHTFAVRAVNSSGADATPATHTWTITPPVPDTTITSAPPASTSATAASFTFTSDTAGATFQCSLDNAAFAACTSPVNLTGLAIGAHTFAVRAVNATGPDATPASVTWTIVPPVPDTTITSGPAATTTATTAAFTFTSAPAGATFQCSLDNAAFAACTSPANLTGLAVGAHTFSVRAVNAGGTDATPAVHSWTITLPVPDTTITSAPAASTTSTSASFAFTATPATGATFQCSLDSGAFAACTSPQAYTALAVGAHTFSVRAVNATGTDGTPATHSWTITSGTPVPAGLVAAYGFEEGAGTTTADSSGSGNPGTLSNATWSTAGRYGNALSFNGTNAWVTIADANSLDLTTTMTISAWVRPSSLAGWRSILTKESPAGLAYALYASDGSRPAAYIRVGFDREVIGTAALAANTWAHVAATYDGTTFRFYINGVQVASQAVSGAMAVSTNPLRIGGNQAWGEYFSGLIDEVRVYSRALSAAEIQSDMNSPVKP